MVNNISTFKRSWINFIVNKLPGICILRSTIKFKNKPFFIYSELNQLYKTCLRASLRLPTSYPVDYVVYNWMESNHSPISAIHESRLFLAMIVEPKRGLAQVAFIENIRLVLYDIEFVEYIVYIKM
jgi:hypothetical protein